MYLNPLAWQLLFAIGMAMGIRKRQHRPLPELKTRWYVAIACVLALTGFWYKFVRLRVYFGWGETPYVKPMPVPYDIPWIDNSMLGPVRLLHFLLVVLLVARYLHQDLPVWRSRFLQPIHICGRNALPVFVAGVVFAYATAAIMQIEGGGSLQMIGLNLLTVIGCIGVAHLADWCKAEPWKPRRAVPLNG